MASNRIGSLTFAAIAAAVLTWTAYVLSRPEWQTHSYLYDDAFYYLIPAHSFAHGQGWTFDGINPTSGLHPLYGYVAALASLFTGYSSAFADVMALSTAATLLVAVWLFLARASHLYGAGIAAIGIAATLAAPKAFFQITSGLEWGWAVMTTMILVAGLIRRDVSVWTTPIAAFFAVLARIDLAIFVAVFVVAVAASDFIHDKRRIAPAARLVLLGAAGAVAGVLVTAINSRLATGYWISHAVLVKHAWSRTNDFLPLVAWNFIVPATGPGLLFTTAGAALALRSVIVIGVFFLIALLVCAHEWRKGIERRAFAIASMATIGAYSIAYSRGINFMFEHYSAPIIVPVALLTCGGLAMSGRYRTVVSVGLAVGLLMVCVRGPWHGIPLHAAIARDAAWLFATLPSGARVGAWNAGIAGWHTRKGVVNLDGLANASVAGYVRSGTLACYLRDANITHIMDFEHMFPGGTTPEVSPQVQEFRRLLRVRLAYDSSALYACLDQKATAQLDSAIGSRYAVFELRRSCAENLCLRQ